MMPSLQALKARNLAAVRDDVAGSSTFFRGMPPLLGLHTTEVCNLRCIMCARSVIPGLRKLPRPALQQFCDDWFPTALKAYAVASLGEPLLGDFDLIVENALRHEVKIDLVTNGTLLTVDLYRDARDALNHVNVSLDACTPDVYERIRVGGDFERVRSNLAAIADERRRHPDGVVLSFSAIVMRSNLATLPDFVRFAASLDADLVELQPLRHNPPLVPEEDPMLSEDRTSRDDALGGDPSIKISHRARETGANVNFGDFCMAPVESRPLREKLELSLDSSSLCWNVAYNLAVFPSGDAFPCCFPTPYKFGNVVEEAPQDVWNGPTARGFRAAHFQRRAIQACSGCNYGRYLPPNGAS